MLRAFTKILTPLFLMSELNPMLRNSLAIAATVIGLSAIAVPVSAATVTFDFTSGDDGGFTTSGSPLWTYSGTQWQTNDQNNGNSFLLSPEFTVEANGDVNLSLDHFYDFEVPGDFIDGGQLQVSINSGAFALVTPDGGYPASPFDGCDVFDFASDVCWSGDSGGSVTDTATIAGLSAGDTFQIRFEAVWDILEIAANPGWGISSVEVDNVVADAAESVPEPGTVVALAMVGGSFLLRKGTKRG